MTDFLGRLEQELVAAARREAAPVRTRRPQRALLSAAAVAAAAAAAAVVVLASEPPRVVEPVPATAAALAGEWQQGPATLTIAGDGWRIETGGAVFYGGLRVEDGRAVLRPAFDPSAQRLPGGGAASERRVCALQQGVYSAAVAGDRLILAPVDEPCAPRSAALTGDDWSRGGP